LTHPNFYSADMSQYRIKALWDQLSRDTIGSTLYVGRDYVGREALLELRHPIDGETQTHGTHTAGIAAGSGAFPLIVVWLVMPTWYWLIMLLIMLL